MKATPPSLPPPLLVEARAFSLWMLNHPFFSRTFDRRLGPLFNQLFSLPHRGGGYPSFRAPTFFLFFGSSRELLIDLSWDDSPPCEKTTFLFFCSSSFPHTSFRWIPFVYVSDSLLTALFLTESFPEADGTLPSFKMDPL